MVLTAQQRDAIERAVEWYFTDSIDKPIFVIGGLAGCGKSTIAKVIIDVIGLAKYNVLFSAYTGKAVSVLRLKGNIAHTIHRTFYKIFKTTSGAIRFNLKSTLPSIIKLIVIDELSMINDKMLEDILSFGIPVLALGDPGQLPPIFGGNKYIDNPDVFLTQVMRQHDTSGVLTLAMKARNKEPILLGEYGDSKVVPFDKIDPIESYDVVLCWKNKTRQELNHMIRSKLGLTTTFPIAREKLICLKNNYIHEIDYEDIPVFLVNGLTCESIDVSQEKNEELILKYKPDFLSHDETYFETPCLKEMFTQYIDPDSPPPFFHDLPENMAVIDYGYALTVHKSQGSEWGNVLVIDEFAGNPEIYNRWLYTAITRGKQRVTITHM